MNLPTLSADFNFEKLMIKINHSLEIIKEEIKKSKICDSLILFGSSVYDNNPEDVDLMLYSKNFINPKDLIVYLEFLDYLDKKYKEIGFSFSSGKPRKKKYSIEISFLPYFSYMRDVEIEFSKEIFKNHKVLFGKDYFVSYIEPKITDIISKLNFIYENKTNSNYFKIKIILRVGMSYFGKNLEKKDLIENFESAYNHNISRDLKNRFKGRRIKNNDFRKELDIVYNLVKSKILDENSGVEDKIYYPKKFLEIYKIFRNLRILWEKENLDVIRSYLIKKDKEFSLLD